MSFRFNFPHSCDFENSVAKDESLTINKNERFLDETCQNNLNRCAFLLLDSELLKVTDKDISLLKVKDVEIKYVLIDSLEVKTEDDVFSLVNILQTDIIPGKYEGGLKIWECALDLASYVLENNCVKNGNTVLELGSVANLCFSMILHSCFLSQLGCGAGLPGVVAYLQGASVTFQDFNPEVLKYSTVPNTVLNTLPENLSTISEVCQFLYGDWEAIHQKFFSDLSTDKKYDVILTSETIYEKSNQKKLLNLMKSALKPDGRIYLAAKIHYFGVGGGIVDFEELVKLDKSFEITSVHRIAAGVERQILTMKLT